MAKTTMEKAGFHNHQDAFVKQLGAWAYKQDTEFTYTFENFFHPFVGELIEKLNKESLAGLLDADFHQSLATEFFDSFYTSLTSNLVKVESFPKEIDLHPGGPYANYNWELLFHIPLTIAVHLSKNQRFAEAQRWFHYIFDPTSNDTSQPTPQRFWKFLAFRQGHDITQIDQLLALLSLTDPSPAEAQLKEAILNGYEAIKNKPFQPHAVARTRQVAYQYCVVMKYLDNLIAWGDSLFRQDTIESINEATQRYVLAANLLGARPQRVPPRGAVRPKTFAQLKQQGLDAMGNALVELEGKFPFNLGLPQQQDGDGELAGPLFGLGRTLYFCIPRNEKMLSYWDTVADRLFKIRNCMNIEGVVRQLALFDPPLDPGMLVKAAAAGLDIGSIVSGLNRPLSPVRSQLLIQKALELAGEVRGLGGALLAAIEKGDAERLSLLRQGHEVKIQQLSQEVRFLQWKQSQEASEALLRSRSAALERYRYYQRLLGKTPDDEAVPETFTLDRRQLTEANFDEAYQALVGQYEKTVLAPDYAPLNPKQEGRLFLAAGEYDELNAHADRAQAAKISAAGTEAVTAILALIPTFHLKASFWGVGPDARVGGGDPLASAGKAVSTGFSIWGMIEDKQGQNAAKKASYERRADEWTQQNILAARELVHIGRQLIGSLIAEQVAHHEYLQIQQQIEHSQAVDSFLHDKFSNEELYGWMQGEISRLYYEYYRFAFDTARQAERTLKQELLRPELDATDYVKFNYWDGGRKGLLSGEALYLDVKRLELAYHEHNRREFELTKNISLRQLDPLALLALKATGSCEIDVPEWLFDLDTPGHYLRRLRGVNLSLPAVTGPYTNINCTLTLTKSTLRRSPLLADDEYPRQSSEDERFIDYFGTVQSIVTSGGNNDSGLFEPSLRDERFLPFEGAGAESSWKLELPAEFRQFDYNTLSDVILQLRYTARQGGAPLADKALEHLKERIAEADSAGLTLLFSLPHDFPGEWHKFVGGDQDFSTAVKRDYFPYFTQGQAVTLAALKLVAIEDGELKTLTPAGIDLDAWSEALADAGAFPLTLPADDEIMLRQEQAQAFVVVKYSLEEM